MRIKKAVLGLVMGFLFVGSGAFAQSLDTSKIEKATISYMNGTVTVDGKPAAIGQVIAKGQIVKTGPKSNAEIVFNGNNILALKEKTQMELDLDSTQRVISVKTGAVTAVLKNLDSKNKGNFAVKTPTTTCGVRGTSFFVDAHEGDDTYFCTCNGHLELGDDHGGQVHDVEAKEHFALVFFKRPDGFVTIAPASGLFGHDTNSLNEIAAKINQKIDWSKAEK